MEEAGRNSWLGVTYSANQKKPITDAWWIESRIPAFPSYLPPLRLCSKNKDINLMDARGFNSLRAFIARRNTSLVFVRPFSPPSFHKLCERDGALLSALSRLAYVNLPETKRLSSPNLRRYILKRKYPFSTDFNNLRRIVTSMFALLFFYLLFTSDSAVWCNDFPENGSLDWTPHSTPGFKSNSLDPFDARVM